MIHTYDFLIEIPLLPDPRTGLPRKMVNPNVVIITMNKEIRVTWHIYTTNLLGEESIETQVQVANNESYINLDTQELMTMEEYDAMLIKPDVMGEYNYWNFANAQKPFPVMEQIKAAGMQFAQRKGWL